MNFKLKNGFIMKLIKEGKEINNTYLKVEATGYHGDGDYDVNNEIELYFNDGEDKFKDLICFISFYICLNFEDLKKEYQNLFKNKNDFQNIYKSWQSFCSSYSEMHDQSISLDINCYYMIDGKKYNFEDVKLNIFEDEEYN